MRYSRFGPPSWNQNRGKGHLFENLKSLRWKSKVYLKTSKSHHSEIKEHTFGIQINLQKVPMLVNRYTFSFKLKYKGIHL